MLPRHMVFSLCYSNFSILSYFLFHEIVSMPHLQQSPWKRLRVPASLFLKAVISSESHFNMPEVMNIFCYNYLVLYHKGKFIYIAMRYNFINELGTMREKEEE